MPTPNDSATVDFRVLGTIAALRDGEVCELGTRRQRAVLARLLIASPETVAAERLVDDIWAGHPPSSALSVVQAHISTLRRTLEPGRAARAPNRILLTRPPGYAITGHVDAQQFVQLTNLAQQQLHAEDPAAAMGTADRALALWRGSPYPEFADRDWAVPSVARLNALRALLTEHRLTALLALGQPQAVVVGAEAELAVDPLHEGLWRLLVTALYQCGRQADALGGLRRAREVLAEQLGLDPGPELHALETQILHHDPHLAPAPVVASSTGLSAHADDIAPPDHAAFEVAASVNPPEGEITSPLLGRGDILTAVSRAAAVTETNRFQTVLLVGEPGMGKTRVAAEFEANLDPRWIVAWGRCTESGGAPALWPWLQTLSTLDEIKPLPDALRALVAGERTSTVTDIAAARFAQHQQVATYLTAVAQERPLLVVLDDLQWADPASLSLLADLPSLALHSRLMLLITARPVETLHGMHDVLAELARHGAQRLTLQGLSLADIESWTRRLGLDASAEQLQARTAGNPFLLGQSYNALAASGSAPDALPAAAVDLLQQRVTRLSDETQSLLHVAALIGRRIDVDLLVVVSGLGEEQVLDALDSALAQGVLTGSTDELRFAHDLMRETVRNSLRPVQQARLHARILAALSASPAVDVFAMVEHANGAASLDPAAAAHWAVQAAELAERRLAYDDAVRWWRRALEVSERLRTAPSPSRPEMLLRLTAALLGAGNAVEALAARALLLSELDPDSDPDLEARALTAIDTPSIWLVAQYGDIPDVLISRLETAISRAPERNATRSRLLASLSIALGYTQDPRRVTLADDAVAIATEIDDPSALGYALNAAYFALDADFDAWRAVPAIAQRLFEIDHRHHLPAHALLGHLMLMPAKITQYEFATADAHAVEAKRLAQRLRLPLPAFQIGLWEASRAALHGDFAAADTLLDELSETAVPWWSLAPLIAVSRAGYLLLQDRLVDAGSLLATVAMVHPVMAHDLERIVLASDPSQAHPKDQSSAEWPTIPRNWLWSVAACVRANAAIHAGAERHRQAAYAELQPYAGLIATNGSSDGGPVDYWLARLALSMGDAATARQHLARLHELATRAGLHWWVERAAHIAT